MVLLHVERARLWREARARVYADWCLLAGVGVGLLYMRERECHLSILAICMRTDQAQQIHTHKSKGAVVASVSVLCPRLSVDLSLGGRSLTLSNTI